MQTSLVILKPDAVERSLVWEVIAKIEKRGLKIVGMKMTQLEDSVIEEHYAHLLDKPFFPKIKSYMVRTPVVILAVKWVNAVATMRTLIGATNPQEALPWTVRWDYALTVDANIIHASDTEENAKIEIQRFFKWEGIYDYAKISDDII